MRCVKRGDRGADARAQQQHKIRLRPRECNIAISPAQGAPTASLGMWDPTLWSGQVTGMQPPVAFLYGALDSHPFFPPHAASGRCILTAATACVPVGVVSAFAEPRNWRTEGCTGCCGGCCPLPSASGPSTTCLVVFPCA